MAVRYSVDRVGERFYRNHATGSLAPNSGISFEDRARDNDEGEGSPPAAEQSLEIGATLGKFLFGKFGQDKVIKPLEADTNTRVHRDGEESLRVSGGEANVSSAITKLKRAPFLEATPLTHFLCIALNEEGVSRAFRDFKEEILSSSASGDSGLSDQIFAKPTRLHLTISMLKLYTPAELERAKRTLTAAVAGHRGAAMSIALGGLELMKGSAKKARVVAAMVGDGHTEEEGIGSAERLQSLCDRVKAAFLEAGFFVSNPNQRKVKLHCTLLNTRWSRGRKSRNFFDAAGFFDRMRESQLGTVSVTGVHLVSFTRFGQDDFYAIESTANFV